MSATTVKCPDIEPQADELSFEVVEHCRCGRCDSAIAPLDTQHDVMASTVFNRVSGTFRRTVAYCRHCGVVYYAVCRLLAGRWEPVRRAVLNEREARRHIARFNARQGDRQVTR